MAVIETRSRAPAPAGPGPAASLAASAAGLGLGLALLETWRGRAAERRNPPVGRFLEVDGVRLHVLDTAEPAGPDGVSGPPVVLLHGNGAMIEDFAASGLLARLAGRRRVVCFDRPGFGHSARPRDRAWTARAQGRLMLAALERLGIERAVILGHSWRTLVALAMAVERPPAVAGLVLVSGYYYPSFRLDVALMAPAAAPLVGDVIRYTVAPSVGRATKPAVERHIFRPRLTPERFEAGFPVGMSLRPWQIRAFAEDASQMSAAAADLEAAYPSLAMPVAVLAGDGDAVADPWRHSARLAGDIPASELIVSEGIGHMFHYAAPDLVAEAVERVAARAGNPARRQEAAE